MMAGSHSKRRYSDRQLEAPRAGAAGINKENPTPLFNQWLVRMTKHERGQARGIGIAVEFREIVKDQDRVPANLDQVSRREAVRPKAPVVIAADCANRRKCPEHLQDDWVTDVTAMNDQVRTSQRLKRLGPN